MTEAPQPFHERPISSSAPALLTHPRDRERLMRMQGTPFVPQLVEMASDKFIEASTERNLLRTTVEVGPRQYPDLDRRLDQLCNRLAIPTKPKFFVSPESACNAYITGVRRHYVVATSGLLDSMTETEFDFVIAHELGHAKAEHMKWQMVAATLATIGIAGISAIAQSTTGILGGAMQAGSMAAALAATAAILDWSRASEFTADRYGYLGTMDPEASCMALAKLVANSTTHSDSFSISELESQADRLHELEANSILGRLSRLVSMLEDTHPMIPQRTVALRDWTGSEVARDVAAGKIFSVPKTASPPPPPPPIPPPHATPT